MVDAEARARAIVAALSRGEPSSEEVFAAFKELDALPAEVVRETLGGWVGPLPDLDRLDDSIRRAHGLPDRPLTLNVIAVAEDADVLDLGAVAEEQLRIAGKCWDGVDLAAEERLDGEISGSFAGTLERRVLSDAERPSEPLFDVLLYAGDSGVIFRAGSTDLVGTIAYPTVEMSDRRARRAIQDVLRAAPPKAVEEISEESAKEISEAIHITAAAAPIEVEAAIASKPMPKKKAAVKKTAAAKTATVKKTAAAKKKTSAAVKKTAAAKKTAAVKKPAKKRVSASSDERE